VERTSQLILRNIAQLDDQGLLLVNPPPDALFQQLAAEGREVMVFSQDFGDYGWLKNSGARAHFGVLPDEATIESVLPSHVLVFQPKEKERLAMMLHHLAESMPADGRLWLVGENQAGIKSAGKQLDRYFDSTTKLDSARHCVLYQSSAPCPAEPFLLSNYQQKWLLGTPGEELRMVSLPGAFAHGRLDKGTELLLQVVNGLEGKARPRGNVLDFGCGIGVIGLSLVLRDPEIHLTLLDNSALALESARLSAAANEIAVTLLPSDGLQSVDQRFDWIVSNPPFHRGVASTLDIARQFFSRAPGVLNKQGKMLLVCNQHLPYETWLGEHFGRIETLASNNHFRVLKAAGPQF